MITISLGSGFVIYLLVMLGLLGMTGGYMVWCDQLQHWRISEEKLQHCTDCGYTFVARRGKAVVRCPRCEKLCRVGGR